MQDMATSHSMQLTVCSKPGGYSLRSRPLQAKGSEHALVHLPRSGSAILSEMAESFTDLALTSDLCFCSGLTALQLR